MRAALHAHILCWFERGKKRDDFKPVPVIERTAPGIEPRQRPLNQKVEPLKEFQHDTVYQQAYVGPITAEMVRPDVRGPNWGGYDVEKLRIAGLARAIQMRLPYLHHCSSLYCLKNRSTCRFFSKSKFATRYLHDVCINIDCTSSITFAQISYRSRSHGVLFQSSSSSRGLTNRTSASIATRNAWL